MEDVSALSYSSGLGVPMQHDKAIAPHQMNIYTAGHGRTYTPSAGAIADHLRCIYKPPSLNYEDNFNNTLFKYVLAPVNSMTLGAIGANLTKYYMWGKIEGKNKHLPLRLSYRFAIVYGWSGTG